MFKKHLAFLLSFLMIIPQCFNVYAEEETSQITDETDNSTESMPSEKEDIPFDVSLLAEDDRDIRDITLGETVTVNIETAYAVIFYRFTPEETGDYVFESTSNYDTYCYLYDADFNQLTSDDDGGSGNNFRLRYTFEAGNTYYLGAKMYSSYTGTYEATLSEYEPIQITELAFGNETYGLRTGNSWYWNNYLTKTPYEGENAITVTSSDPEVAQLSSDGQYFTGIAKGTAVITATADNGVSASTTLNVGNYASSIGSVNSMLYVAVGSSVKPEYVLYPTDVDTSDETVTWSITNDYNDSITLAEDGTVTAVKAGNANVRATISNGNYTTFTINAYDMPTSLSFKKEVNVMRANQSSQYIWNYLDYEPSSAGNAPLTITSSDEEIISISGNYLYPKANGTAEITVTAENGVSASGTFKVGNYATSIYKNDYDTVKMKIGETKQLSYELYPYDSDTSDEVVTWSVDSSYQDIISVSEDGVVTALKAGYGYVRATILNGQYVSYSISIYENLTSLSFEQENLYVRPDYSLYIWDLLNYEPYNASGYPLTIESSDETIARIEGNNIYGVASGTAEITVSANDDLKATATIHVGNYAYTIYGVDHDDISLAIGDSKQLEYELSPSDEDTSDEVVTWSVNEDSKECLAVSEDGVVTALKEGSGSVRATTLNGHYAEYYITVYENLTSLAFREETNYIRTGSSGYIWNYLDYEPDSAYGYPVTIESSDTDVIRAEGKYLYAEAAGSAVITVSAGEDVTALATFNVGNYATSIGRSDWSTVNMAIGSTKQLEYILYPRNGDVSDEVVTWSLDYADNDCITVDENGLVSARAAGTGSVSATTLCGYSTSFYINVYADPVSLSFTKPMNYLRKGYSGNIWNYLNYMPDNCYGYPLTVESSDEDVLAVSETTVTGISDGTAEVTVTSANGIVAKGSFTIGNYATSIGKVQSGTIYMPVGETKQLEYNLYPIGADMSDESVTWSITSSTNSCITLSETGEITSRAGGTASVRAETLSGQYTTYSIRVYTDPASISFNKETNYLRINSSGNIWNYLTYQPDTAYGAPLTITSSDENVIRAENGNIYAVSKGTAEITVTTENGISASGIFKAGYYASSIYALDSEINIGIGDSVQLEYDLYSSNGDTSDEVVTWSVYSSDNDCISLDDHGNVTGLAGGSARVRATTLSGSYTTFYVYVYEEPTELTFRKETFYLDKYSSSSIWNYLKYLPDTAYGYPLEVSSSDENILKLDEDHYLRGVSNGTATVTVTAENGISCSAEFVVGDYAYSIGRIGDYSTYLKVGETKQLEYRLYPENTELADEEVTWSVPYASSAVSVDENGVVTALRYGSGEIRATIKNESYVTYYINVVEEPESLSFMNSANYLDKYSGWNIWQYLDYKPSTSYNYPLTITSSDENIVRVSGNYLYGINSGNATVTVETDNGLKTSATFTVGNYASGISGGNMVNMAMLVGDEKQLTYTLMPEGGDFSDEEVVWSITNDYGHSGCISVDQNGLVKALKTGTANVEAKTKTGRSISYYIEVVPNPRKLFFRQLNYYLGIGGSRAVWNDLDAYPGESDSFNVQLASSNPQFASITDNRIINGVSKGTAVITAKTEDGLMAKTRYHIGNYATRLSAKNGNEKRLLSGETVQLEYEATGSDNCSDDEFTWTLSANSEDAVRLSDTGLITALKPGYAEVRLTSKAGLNVWYYIYVMEKPESLEFGSDMYEIPEGYSTVISVISEPDGAEYAMLNWESSDPEVVTISRAGTNAGYLYGRKEGKATIRAISPYDDKVYAEAEVTVYTPVKPTSMSVASAITAYVDYGITVPVEFSPAKANRRFRVECSNDNVSIYSGEGFINVYGNKAGTTKVTLTSEDGSLTASTTVTVYAGEPPYEGSFTIGHYNASGNTRYSTRQNPEEYVFVVGEQYSFTLNKYYSGYYYANMFSAASAINETGLFTDTVTTTFAGDSYDLRSTVTAIAAKAGTVETELVKGRKVKLTVLDSAWLGTNVTADSSVPAALVNEVRNSDLGVRYDAAFAAAALQDLDKITVGSNQKAVVQSWLDVNLTAYQKDELGNIRFELRVEPKAKAVTMNKTAANTSAGTVQIAETRLNVTSPVRFEIPVRNLFGSANIRNLKITHKAYNGNEYEYDDALNDEYVLYFTESNGFGTFTIIGTVSSYSDAVYTWIKTDDGYEVSAKAESLEDDPPVTETVTAVYEVVTEPGCFSEGKGLYTATFTNPLFTTQTKSVSIPAIGHHEYGEPEYTWSNDLSTVTAKAVCTVCGEEVTETVNTTSEVIKEATETEEGTRRYTAEFTNELFETQTKDVVIPATGSGSDIVRIWFTEDEYTMTAGKTMVLIAHTDPVYTTDIITFTSSDSSVVSNESNLLTAHKAGTVTITATASNGVSASCTIRVNFADVSDPKKFFYDPVYWAFNHEPQITKGTDDTTFSPNDLCTRGHIVTFLYRAAGEPEVSGEMPFKDVKKGKFYYNAVLWAVQNEITTGTSDTTFSPNENCTRGHIVTFLYRYLNSPAVSGSVPFTDVKKGKFYYNPVLWAVQNNITTGTTPTTFSPNENCTRGQAVTFLYRAVENN